MGRTADRSDGLFRTFNIVALFSSAMWFAYSNGPAPVKEGGGLLFDADATKNLLVSEPVVFGLPALYLLAVWGSARFMADKEPLTNVLRNYVQPLYNVAQVVLCGYMVYGLWPQVDVAGGNPFGLNTKPNASIEHFVFIHYLSKYMDWLDTFFMVGKKNFHQVSFLQVFHHATIGMVWGFLLNRGWGSGTAAYGAFINSVTQYVGFLHSCCWLFTGDWDGTLTLRVALHGYSVLMYTHFFFTSYGYRNPFKSYITTFQLSQFASCIVHALCVLAYEHVYPVEFSYLQVSYHVIMLYLFGFQMQWAPQWCVGSATDLAPAKAKKET